MQAKGFLALVNAGPYRITMSEGAPSERGRLDAATNAVRTFLRIFGKTHRTVGHRP